MKKLINIVAAAFFGAASLAPESIDARTNLTGTAHSSIITDEYFNMNLTNRFYYSGIRYYEKRKYAKAIENFENAVDTIAPSRNSKGNLSHAMASTWIAHSYRQLAYISSNNLNKQAYFLKSLELYRGAIKEYELYGANFPKLKKKIDENIADEHLFIASSYYGMGDVENGTKYAITSLKKNSEEVNRKLFVEMIWRLDSDKREWIIRKINKELDKSTSAEIIKNIKLDNQEQ